MGEVVYNDGMIAVVQHGSVSGCRVEMFRREEDGVLQYARVVELKVADALGAGTCEVEGYDDGIDEGMDGDWYSYAPPTWYLSCGHRCEGSERPRYCPRCGKRVVEVDE